MQDGMYKVSFRTPLGQGAGVVVLEHGQLRGGDSSMFYVGTYRQDGDTFSAEVAVSPHSQEPGRGSVLGVSQAQLNLHGRSANDSATLSGSSRQAHHVSFTATLTRLAA